MYSAVSELSPCKVRRDEETCIHCSRCTNVCHAFIDVEHDTVVRDTECDGCMDCVKVCPVEHCLEAKGPGGITIQPWVWGLLVVAVWLAIFGVAKLTGNWDTRVTPDQMRAAVQAGVIEAPSMPQSQQ
jgi:ferredoxin